MAMFLLLLLLGGVGLYFGADWLVEGSSAFARSLGIRTIVIGLTVVAYGTSAPELVVSGAAAWDGNSGIALGNVIGSNIANIGLILGITALLSPPKVEGTLIWREVPVFLLAALAVPFVLRDGEVSRIEGAILLLGALAFTVMTIVSAKGDPNAAEEVPAVPEGPAPKKPAAQLGLALFGLVVLLLGGKFFVDGAVGIARAMGMSERIVGLTIVAVGTSLPELAASIVAARRGHSSIAVGNVVGSNIFNVLLILGTASVLQPIKAEFDALMFDMLVLVGFTFVCAAMMRGARSISRREGVVLLTGYVGFVLALVFA